MNQIDDGKLDVPLLRVLEALLEERHVTQAARRLGMSQSATSHALARLREVFGDPLFVRGPHGVVPTDRALALEPQVRDVLRQLRGLTALPQPVQPQQLRRTFVIEGADYMELVMLPRFVPWIRCHAPYVQLVVRSPSLLYEEEMAKGALDMSVGVFADVSPRIVLKKLFDETFVCLFRKGHPALNRPLTPKRWAALDHVLISPYGQAGGVVDQVLEEHQLQRRVVVRTASFLTVPLLVEATDCVTTLPKRVAEVMTHGRNLEWVAPPLPLPGFTIKLAYHERSRNDPAHAWLREQMAATIQR
jgi:DNA-binding transcriptional LysR family regulator